MLFRSMVRPERARRLLTVNSRCRLCTVPLRIDRLETRELPAFTFSAIDVPGATMTDINGINDLGQIVGTYTSSGITRGFLLSDGDYTTLDVPGASSTSAWDINDAGQIAGSYVVGGVTHAFLFSDGAYATIDVPGASRTMPRGINDAGAIVGEYTAAGILHGYLWEGGVLTTIDVPGASFTSYASEINNAGDTVGRFDIPGTNSGFLLKDGNYTTINFPGAASSAALGINSAGEIIGGHTTGGVRHGFLLNDGGYTSFDVPGSTFTTPRKINDSGLIVGGYGSGGTTHGFIATARSPVMIEGIVVNDGSEQRSMVRSLTVTFDSLVNFDSNAFELKRQDGSLVALSVATSNLNARTVAHLTFSGLDILGGSLADGNYSLTVHGDLIYDALGRSLDGDGDGAEGGDRVAGFHREFGDADGDGDTDQTDFQSFLASFGPIGGPSGYLWYFDFDADGEVDGLDIAQFNQRR